MLVLTEFSNTSAVRYNWTVSGVQSQIQDVPEGVCQPQGSVPTCYLADFSQNLHENEEILGREVRVPRTPHLPDPLMGHENILMML